MGTWGHRCTFCKNDPQLWISGSCWGSFMTPSFWALGNSWASSDPQSLHFDPQFFISGCFRGHPRPLNLKPSATPWCWRISKLEVAESLCICSKSNWIFETSIWFLSFTLWDQLLLFECRLAVLQRYRYTKAEIQNHSFKIRRPSKDPIDYY